MVEPAAPGDLSEIAELAALVWRKHYPGIISRDQIEYMLGRMYDPRVMLAELEGGITYDRLILHGKLIGFAAYGPASQSGQLKLHKLYVHPDFQRQGLAALLLKRVENMAHARSFTLVVLTVNKKNVQAIAAYRKHGFCIRDSVIFEIGQGFVMDDYIMAKTVGK